MEVQLIHQVLQISFSKNPLAINRVKTLHGRKYEGGSRWSAPVCVESVGNLISWGFKMDQRLVDWYYRQTTYDEVQELNLTCKRPLLPYQEDGVRWIEAARGRTIVGDQQGLGKTAEQLAWLELHPELRPAVVVCPASAKWTYHSEARWVVARQGAAHVISGMYNRGSGPLPSADIYILNYEILFTTSTCIACHGTGKQDRDGKTVKCRACKGNGKNVMVRKDLEDIGKPKAVIIDECHYLQDPLSYRTLAITKLCKDVPYVIMSSGTPIKHRPCNFYPALSITRPDLFPSFWPFGLTFCAGHRTRFGWDFSGSSNMALLHKTLTENKVLLRRVKKDVLPQLPKIRRAPVLLELDHDSREKYDFASNDFLEWLRVTDVKAMSRAVNAEALTRISYLKQMAARFKMAQALQWIDEFLKSGDKLIVFAHHRAMVEMIHKKFSKISVVVDGGTSAEQKRDAETAFQACGTCGVKKDKHDIEPGACKEYVPGKIKLFIGSLAAKESLTLTAAEDVAFVELWDSPKDHEQAEERSYGRVSDPHGTTAWYLIAGGTIEENMLEMQEHKRKIIDAIIDGKTVVDNSLTQMLERMKEVK